MFGRNRRRPASNPALNHGVQPSSSAATAAAQAFLKSQASAASLAAAAAGAALRSRPTTPTSVADVQTKRMLRRTASNTSQGSSGGGSLRGPSGSQLERRGSVGSMTERTFRDPSPNRGSARPSIDSDAPPVPAIPKNLNLSHRRTASLETPVTRVASPPPNMATGRGSSLGPLPSGSQPGRKPAGQRFSNLSSVSELTGPERPANRGQSQVFQKPNLVYDPNTRSFRPEAELLFLEQSIQDAATKPVRRKKKTVTTQSLVGSHLAEGTAGGRIRGTAVDEIESRESQVTPQQAEAPETTHEPVTTVVQEPEPAPKQTVTTPKKKKRRPVIQNAPDVDYYASTGTSDGDSDASERRFVSRPGTLGKKPSIVREDREKEEQEDDESKIVERQAALTRLESLEARTVSPTPRAPGLGHGRPTDSNDVAPPQLQPPPQAQPQVQAASLTNDITKPDSATELPADKGQGQIEKTKPARVQSVSPVRTAHFMQSPETLAVRRDPPPRAASPRKSALKHSSASPRGGSPAPDYVGKGHGSTLSEVSDTSTAVSDTGLVLPKKKSVRVSFDDENTVVVGEAAGQPLTDSPLSSSPQTKRSWFSSISRGKRRDVPVIDDEDDEIMKPRPALPSFGSIREKKVREVEDRPLVKPSEPLQVNPSPPLSVSPAEFVEPLGQSHDHLAGALFVQDQASKNAANISKSREPLPPQVTSVEGSGYVSDSSSSTYSLNADPSASERLKKAKKQPGNGKDSNEQALASPKAEEKLDLEAIEPEIPVEKTNGNGNIPTPAIDTSIASKSPVDISSGETTPTQERIIPSLEVTSASPTAERSAIATLWPYVPGGFPETSSDSGQEGSEVSLTEPHVPGGFPGKSEPDVVDQLPTDLTPAAIGISEPEAAHSGSKDPVVGQIATKNLHHIQEEDEMSTDHDSIYSDAAEDLSDLEGDGFMSLDAVVESPLPPSPNRAQMQVDPQTPTPKAINEKVSKSSGPIEKSTEPMTEEGWDKAQAYWSGLTADKKRQLEQAALQKDESSDEDIDPTPVPKPKQNKKAPLGTTNGQSRNLEHQQSKNQGPTHNRTYQITPGAKAGPDGMPSPSAMRAPQRAPEEEVHMRKTMRAGVGSNHARQASSEEVHMRSSMRNGTGGSTMRGSMRGSLRGPAAATPVAPVQQKASLQKKYRPVSQQVVKAEPVQPKTHTRTVSAGSGFAAQTMRSTTKTPLRRTDSIDSDISESSFKRARQPSEGFSMRRSMRGTSSAASQGRPQSPEVPVSKTRSSRFSLRSLSPTGSAFLRGSKGDAPPVSLPTTMRSNRPDAPTLRASTAVAQKSGTFGRSRTSPALTRAPVRASRFADSSDDEDVAPTFRSRFVDSSDDEDVVIARPVSRPLTAATMRSTPVRAIPRQNNLEDGDSSDLPDTDDEKPEPKKIAKIAPQTPTPVPTSGSTLASGSLRRSGSGRGTMGMNPSTVTTIIAGGRPEQKRRGSFMTSILKRRKDPGSKVRKSDAESPARRDTPLERSRSEVQAVKRQDSGGPGGRKLEKRGSPGVGRVLSVDSTATGAPDWPLPLSTTATAEEKAEEALGRPSTADGTIVAAESQRPDIGSRRATATGLSGIDIEFGTPKKKKKFGRLRRAFGLDE